MYDTPRAALVELTDDELLERVAVQVLRVRFPELRITGPSGDMGRDGFGRRLFGARDEIVVLVSTEKAWTSKLKRDLSPYQARPAEARPGKAIFVTSRSTKQITQQKYKDWASDTLAMELEIVDLGDLALDLQSDGLHYIAENDLGVRPRQPRVLLPPAAFWDSLQGSLPGVGSRLVGRDTELQALRDAIDHRTTTRVVVLEGPDGIGKTRLAVDGSREVATTLVAGGGTSITSTCLSDVPLGSPAVVIVDDADRSADLSGIAAMLRDPRYGRVKVVLTVRPAQAVPVLARIGQERASIARIPVAGLSRSGIDQIVTGHGLNGEAFRRHVIDIARGNPLLAHTASSLAVTRGTYSWDDTAALLGDLIAARLQHLGSPAGEHQAAATALAVMTSAKDGTEMAAMSGTITGLPHEPHQLDVILDDLAQAGIAVTAPYALRPDAAAPVLTASALDPGAHVKIKLVPMLQALGRAALITSPGSSSPDGAGMLGIGPLSAGLSDAGHAINPDRLAAQLSVVAQAAHLRSDGETLAVLRRSVMELLADNADIASWIDVLTVAHSVAPAAPALAGELREALIRQWPPAPTARLWDNDPGLRYKFDTETLLRQATALGEQACQADPDRAISWMLECAWLCHPVLGDATTRLARDGIRSALRVSIRTAGESWDHVLDHRQQALDAVRRWSRNRRAGPPAGLAHSERHIRDQAVADQIALAALGPFLSMLAEDHAVATLEDPDTFVWSQHLLPDDPRAVSILNSAARSVSEHLPELDHCSPDAAAALMTIVRLPRNLRAETARGTGHGQPLPDHAARAMNDAAAHVAAAVASHWNTLPLPIRYIAAESAVRPGGRPASDLATLAASGDPVAAAALADNGLQTLLVVLPLDQHPRHRVPGSSQGQAPQRRAHAEQLARQLTTSDAIELLQTIDPQAVGYSQYDSLMTFARTAGRDAPDPGAVLRHLAATGIAAADAVLEGLLQSHPQLTITWLEANITDPDVARLAISAGDQLPPGREAEFFDAIIASITASDDPPGTDSEPDSAQLAVLLAAHLSGCRADPRDRLTKLATLGSTAPAAALPRILAAIDQILDGEPGRDLITGETGLVLRGQLAAILARALASADNGLAGDIDDDVAVAAVTLGRAAPDETARLLVDRILSGKQPAMPFAWEHLLAGTPPDQREQLALALQRHLGPYLASTDLASDAEQAALDFLCLAGHGTPGWTEHVHRWAAGEPADRGRAAIAIRHCWNDRLWHDLVPGLLDAGLDEPARSQLRRGVTGFNDAIDPVGIGSRLRALEPLLEDSRSVVRLFAAECRDHLTALLTFLRAPMRR